MDLIDRQTAIHALRVAYWDKNIQSAKDDPCIVDTMTDWAIRQVKALPSVQPKQKKGTWITDKYGHVVCSECKWNAPSIMVGCLVDRHLDYDKSDYCWHCGADMRGEQEGMTE